VSKNRSTHKAEYNIYMVQRVTEHVWHYPA
jgi:hypothetical protein